METTRSPRAAVFTDLDGTLLDAETYSWEPARPALAALRRRGVAIVACTSKTASELALLGPRIELAPPAIVENGAAIAWSWDESIAPEALAGGYAPVREALVAARRVLGLPLLGFGDVDAAAVARVTGLAPEDSVRARRRVGDEPFWSERPLRDEEVESLRSFCTARGLQLTRGGRFFHLHGESDKGAAVRHLLGTWTQCRRTAAFGDAANDVSLLQAVEHRFAVRRADGKTDPTLAAVSGVHLLSVAGPAGFREGVEILLARWGDEAAIPD